MVDGLLDVPPSAPRRGRGESRNPKVFAAIQVPDDGDLLDEVAHLRDGKVQGCAVGIAPFQRMAEVIVFDFHWIGSELLHHWLLVDVLSHKWLTDEQRRIFQLFLQQKLWKLQHFLTSPLSPGVSRMQKSSVSWAKLGTGVMRGECSTG